MTATVRMPRESGVVIYANHAWGERCVTGPCDIPKELHPVNASASAR